MREGEALPQLRKLVTQHRIAQYARVSGDANPVHLDASFAAASSFGRLVAHGMLVLAFVSEMLTHTFGERWLASGRLKVRFKAPVYPEETVVTFGQVTRVREENGKALVECSVGCRKESGEEVIAGEASLLLAGQG